MDVTGGDVWVDGRILPGPEATVHLLNPSLHYGWGAYEGIRFYPAHPGSGLRGPLGFRLHEHLQRLRASAQALGMRLPYRTAELVEACEELVERSGLDSGYLRPLVMLAPGAMSVAAQLEQVSVVIGCWAWSGYLPDAGAGIRVRTSGWVRTGPNQIPPSVKSTGGYLNPSLARLEAVRGGDHEALLLNSAGRVAEASAANVFAVLDGVLTTPPLHEGILPGITRASLLELAADLGIPAAERPLAPAELRVAEEVLLAGTAMEVVAVTRLDGLPVADGQPGPVYQALRTTFDEVITGRVAKRHAWLSPLTRTADKAQA
jgi:branched-chain amino acid aminotransferase